MAEWICRSRDWIARESELPGVWRRRDGGFFVRGRVKDPRTGKLREVNRALPDVTKARDAFAWLQAELDKVRAGSATPAPSAIPRFRTFAITVFERKLDLGKIKSAAGRAKWNVIIKKHLIPAFGDIFVDQLGPADVKAWQSKTAALIRAGKLAPTTANTILAVLRQITDEAVDDYDIRDPLRGVEPFDTREHVTYTEEEPNALAPADVPRFLAKLRELRPQHYAMVLVGFATGLRPSSLRPLRRSGPHADLKWEEGVLLVRRSHTEGDEIMETTKTDQHQRLVLPPELMQVLEWHRDEVLVSKRLRQSELLFPGPDGGLRSRWSLRKTFDEVAKAIGLPYEFTPRGMRRTFQDLSRAVGVRDIVTRAISGHATEQMQRRYSSVAANEVTEAMAKVISIAVARDERAQAASKATADSAGATEAKSA